MPWAAARNWSRTARGDGRARARPQPAMRGGTHVARIEGGGVMERAIGVGVLEKVLAPDPADPGLGISRLQVASGAYFQRQEANVDARYLVTAGVGTILFGDDK